MLDDPNFHYAVALSDICSPFAALRPPRRVSVSQGAADNLVFKTPGAAGGAWSSDGFEYLVEPMDMLASRQHEGEVFCGPARTGKTAGLLLGWLSHQAINDPGDMLFIQMSQDKAREFSKTDVSRALESPNLAAIMGNSSKDDNTHDKMFVHGMWFRIGWPTGSNVSGSTYRFGAITDYDRIKNRANVDGEGALWPLVLKRTTTFMSRGMALVESSPGEDLKDPNWKPATPHEAPPTKESILSIYNRSDRRRWYWRCPQCGDRFEAAPGLGLFHLPPEEQLVTEVREMDIDKLAIDFGKRIICPHGCVIGAGDKAALNRGGRWISEAEILGSTPSAPIAGYWLGGVAAAYQNWRSMVSRYLYGLRDYALNGSEETLKTTTNTDQAMPYMSMHLREAALKARAPEDRTEDIERFVCPDWTRLVAASVDVQGGGRPRFVVQVHAVGEHFEQQLVNRFTIFESRREGVEQGTWAPLDPASYPEDWDRITEEVVRSTYRTSIDGREIKVLRTMIDTGGEDGVTDKAYAYYRRMRKAGLHKRIVLYKGANTHDAPLIRETMQGLTKDVPVYICNGDKIADAVHAGLQRETPGPGYYHFPKPKSPTYPDRWITQAFFDELKAEVRNENGKWTQIRKRNETFDLCKMIYAALLTLQVDRKGFWDSPPDWAQPLVQNRELVTVDERREMKSDLPVEQVSATPPRPARRERRIAQSSYLTR